MKYVGVGLGLVGVHTSVWNNTRVWFSVKFVHCTISFSISMHGVYQAIFVAIIIRWKSARFMDLSGDVEKTSNISMIFYGMSNRYGKCQGRCKTNLFSFDLLFEKLSDSLDIFDHDPLLG